MNIKEKFDMQEFLNSPDGSTYYKSDNIKVSRWAGFDDWRITDLTNALTSGQDCIEYTIKAQYGQHGNLITTNFIHSTFGNDLAALWSYCDAIGMVGFDSFTKETEHGKLEFYRSVVKGIRVFSPFNLNKVKPLKAMPKKWTMKHVYSVLINGQFKDLKCTGVYSDDYAWDAACDYRRGEIKAPLEFVKKMIEHPSGWKCWDHKDSTIGIHCHSFDSNTFVPAI